MKAAIYSVILALAGAATWFQLSHRQPPLREYKALPDFNLVERSGHPLGLDELKGKVWLADFIYTTCPGPCPMLSSRFSSLQKAALKDPDVRLVSISINPDHDTPAVLREYAQHFQASDRWLFLTGPKKQIHDLVIGGFMQAVVEQDSQEMPVVHSAKLVLVDRRGVIRNFYDGVDAGNDETVLRDIQRLRRESK